MVALSLRAQNIGIDLGTANTIVYLENEGIVTLRLRVVFVVGRTTRQQKNC